MLLHIGLEPGLGVLRIRIGADRRLRRFGSSILGWIRLLALRILQRRGSGSGSADPIDLSGQREDG